MSENIVNFNGYYLKTEFLNIYVTSKCAVLTDVY